MRDGMTESWPPKYPLMSSEFYVVLIIVDDDSKSM